MGRRIQITESQLRYIIENINEQKVGSGRKLKIGVSKKPSIKISLGKSASGFLEQGNEEPKTPVEQWDEFLKNDKKLKSKMSPYSQKIWDFIKNSEDEETKGFAVLVLEYFNTNKWQKVSLGQETQVIEDPKEDLVFYAKTLQFPMNTIESSQFFEDNKWVLKDTFINSFNEQIIQPLVDDAEQENMKCEDGTPLYLLTGIKVVSSASRFRNGINMSWLDLSKKRNDAALKYTLDQLKNIGVGISSDLQTTQEWKGSNGDGTSGPNPGYTEDNKPYTLSTDGDHRNVISNPTEQQRNQYGAPLKRKEEYDKFKTLIVYPQIIKNVCTLPIEDSEPDVKAEYKEHKASFSRKKKQIELPGLKIWLEGNPKTKIVGTKPMPCPKEFQKGKAHPEQAKKSNYNKAYADKKSSKPAKKKKIKKTKGGIHKGKTPSQKKYWK